MGKLMVGILLASLGMSANAGIINNFTEGYDVSNWTLSLDGGIVDLSGAPFSIIEISADDDVFGGPTSTDFTIAALGSGLVTFDWDYSTADSDGSFFDPFGYLLNGVFTQLTLDGLFDPQSGAASFLVATDDIFGFSQQSTDSFLGSGKTVISGFSAPGSIPEPSSLLLLALGLIGVAGFSKRRKSA